MPGPRSSRVKLATQLDDIKISGFLAQRDTEKRKAEILAELADLKEKEDLKAELDVGNAAIKFMSAQGKAKQESDEQGSGGPIDVDLTGGVRMNQSNPEASLGASEFAKMVTTGAKGGPQMAQKAKAKGGGQGGPFQAPPTTTSTTQTQGYRSQALGPFSGGIVPMPYGQTQTTTQDNVLTAGQAAGLNQTERLQQARIQFENNKRVGDMAIKLIQDAGADDVPSAIAAARAMVNGDYDAAGRALKGRPSLTRKATKASIEAAETRTDLYKAQIAQAQVATAKDVMEIQAMTLNPPMSVQMGYGTGGGAGMDLNQFTSRMNTFADDMDDSIGQGRMAEFQALQLAAADQGMLLRADLVEGWFGTSSDALETEPIEPIVNSLALLGMQATSPEMVEAKKEAGKLLTDTGLFVVEDRGQGKDFYPKNDKNEFIIAGMKNAADRRVAATDKTGVPMIQEAPPDIPASIPRTKVVETTPVAPTPREALLRRLHAEKQKMGRAGGGFAPSIR